jgi:hypothetical protein
MAILSTGVITYSFSRARKAHAERQALASGFTITYQELENGKLVSTVTRQVKANGEFLEDRTLLSSGKHSKLAGTLAHGAVRIDDAEKKLFYLGDAAIARRVSESELRYNAAKSYLRDDSLLGYRVIVTRRCDAQNVQCSEYWQAIELGAQLLKIDETAPDSHTTKQAVQIVLGEPSFTVPEIP